MIFKKVLYLIIYYSYNNILWLYAVYSFLKIDGLDNMT